MNSESWIALATVVASTIITGLGLFFRYRERTTVFRQVLYTKQVDVSIGILTAYANVRNRMIPLFEAQSDVSEQDRIWHTARADIDALAVMASSAAAMLPSSAYEAYVSLHTETRSIMNRIAHDPLPVSALDTLDTAAISFINEVRGLLGADTLSDENRKAFVAVSDSGSIRDLPTQMRNIAEHPTEV
jgi:hypothetical protein